MTCFYNIAKNARRELVAEGAQNVEPFDDEDRDVICEFIQQTDKPCIAYKILGASRKCSSPESVREAFKFALARIKPIDIVNVGMFQKHSDQVAMNAEIVREIG